MWYRLAQACCSMFTLAARTGKRLPPDRESASKISRGNAARKRRRYRQGSRTPLFRLQLQEQWHTVHRNLARGVIRWRPSSSAILPALDARFLEAGRNPHRATRIWGARKREDVLDIRQYVLHRPRRNLYPRSVDLPTLNIALYT